ncbi:putative RTA1 domain protein [Halenospora varia]|nr:putative RTA1 domain protein [Halenospora varia]
MKTPAKEARDVLMPISSNDNGDSNAFVLYRYEPSLIAAIVFTALFAITTFLHVFQMCKKKTWYFIPLIVGGCFEWIGYIGRIISHSSPTALGPYIMQTLLLLIAPALFAATIYMILGRIILLLGGSSRSPIRKSVLTKLFVCGDVLSFLAQAAGGGMMAQKTESSVKNGQRLILIGLVLQLIFFGLFILVSITFHRRMLRNSTILSTPGSRLGDVWQKYMYALYTSSFLILMRGIFRVVEYIQGNDGTIMRHEVYLYVFDAGLMLFTMVALNVYHPGNITNMGKRIADSEF